jgi:peptidoglycan hydrolase CwlO-like protein
MSVTDDIEANYNRLVASTDKLKTTDESLRNYVNGLKATSVQQAADLAKATADLAAAGVDVTRLQAISEGITAQANAIDAVEAADAVIATA